MNIQLGYVLCAGLFLFGLAGCGAESDNVVEMKVDFTGEGTALSPTLYSLNDGRFYTNGFPTGLRQSETQAVDLSDFPRPFQIVTQNYINGIETQLSMTGYHTISPIYLPFTAAIDVASLPQEPSAYTLEHSSIQVVDIDPHSPEFGRRFPLSVTQTRTMDSYRPADLLQILPTLGVSLRPDTTYAAIVNNQLPVAADKVLQQNAQLGDALGARASNTSLPDNVSNLFEPLRHYLALQRIDPRSVVAATVWHTGEPGADMQRGANAVANLPLAEVTDLELAHDFPDYCAIRGYVDIPGFQNGTLPYLLTGGRIEWDDNGNPIQQYSRKAEIILNIPKNTTMPMKGFPLMEYTHGAGGDAEQVFTRGTFEDDREAGKGPAWVAAQRGWASSGMAGHFGMDHAGPIIGFGLFPYNVENPAGMLGTYYQMVWERVYFRRVLNQLEIPASLCEQAIVSAGEEAFRFDPDLRVLMGQSLGNWSGSMQLVVDPDPYQGAVLTGVAGTWIKFFTNQPAMKNILATLLPGLLPSEQLDEVHPFLMLMEWLLGGADPVVYLDQVLKYPNKTAPHVLVISGLDDQSGYEPAQRPHLMALGVDLAGPDLGDSDDTTLFPHMAISGASHLDYPVSNNIAVPRQGLRTAAVVRYENAERPDHNGHHVTFDLEAPKHQYGCFLQYLSWQQTPVVSEGVMQGGICP